MGATCIWMLVSPTSIIDDWLIGTIALAIFGWEKFTWSCYCESTFDLGGESILHLVDPNTSSPSKCDILAEILELEVYLAIVVHKFELASHIGWLYAITVHSCLY
jgi:hypothetical protein